jgi:hypothetical protein
MPPTRYTIITPDDVNDELLTIWLNRPAERTALTRASHQLDVELRTDADQKGAWCPVLYKGSILIVFL